MTDVDVSKRLEELKMFTRQTLNVEQRIEIARQQQAIREAKKVAKEELAKSKEKARHARELEKNERLEAQRKERELKNQQALEVMSFKFRFIYCWAKSVDRGSYCRQSERRPKNWRRPNKKKFNANNR